MGRNYGNKTIYVRDWSKWEKAQECADAMGLSMSEYIEVALDNMMKPSDENAVLLNKIRELVCG